MSREVDELAERERERDDSLPVDEPRTAEAGITFARLRGTDEWPKFWHSHLRPSDPPTAADGLKEQVRAYWDRASCGTWAATAAKYSREYFEQIEAERYRLEPEIHAFAQFTRAHGQRVLEVGVGAGTDFLQWVRAGANAVGIDLTREAIDNVSRRLRVYGLSADVRQADCEQLPFPDNTFDLAYSWGVIHHSPDTLGALDEIVRVLRPGGVGKIMVYNRHSIRALATWLAYAVKRRRPWHSLSRAIWHHMESVGTKAYTTREMRTILATRPVESVQVRSSRTCWDRPLPGHGWREWAKLALPMAIGQLCGWGRQGWFLTCQFTKRR